ncbi:ankyrin [Rostrohypoxylon terebratum]|nr:ankyrin [Rostrohypoxylon terebratum]
MNTSSQKPEPEIDPDTILNNVIKKGDVEATRQMLKSNPGFFQPGSKHLHLHYAAAYGHRDIVKILLEHGAEIDARCSSQQWTPLHYATKNGQIGVMATLLKAGANINARAPLAIAPEHMVYTPVKIAAQSHTCDALHLLVAKGAFLTSAAALHVAVKHGRHINALILCAFGCDPLEKDSNGENSFDHANKLQEPHRHEIKQIMQKWSFEQEKLSALRKNLIGFVNDEGKINFGPLLGYASNSSDESSLEYAVEVGGAKIVDWRDSIGRTALHNTAARGNLKGVEFLLKRGADMNSLTGKRKWTALLIAVDSGHEQVVRTLCQWGSNLEAKTDQGDNAITLARKWNHTRIVKFLETLTSSQALSVPSDHGASKRGSPNSFEMIRADQETFAPSTAQALRRVRIVRSPKVGQSEAKEQKSFQYLSDSKKSVTADVEHNSVNEPDVEGGFDGGFFSTSPDQGLVQPKTFSNLANTWRYYFDFKEKDKKVRVAILDTGIDLDHEDWLQPRALRFEHGKPVPASGEPRQIDRIKNSMNFCGGSETVVQDLDGHGTQVAGIILRLAPRAEIDIARVCIGDRNRGNTKGKDTVSSSADKCPQPTAVAKAIDWAIENHVDIINISFGYEYSPTIVREALKRAQKKRIVVFAAMSNGGSYHKPTWPAREEICAIGIHSCDDDGNKSNFTPLPHPNTDNFIVVGDNVLTHWPTAKGSPFKMDSGTSFATPVAVAMAALILAFVQQTICKGNYTKAQELIGLEVLEELHENSGMIRLLKSVSFPGPDPGYLLIHPELLWKDLQFPYKKSKDPSKSREHAWDVIINALIP